MFEKFSKALLKTTAWVISPALLNFVLVNVKKNTGINLRFLLRLTYLVLPIVGAIFFHWSSFEIITLIWANCMIQAFFRVLKGKTGDLFLFLWLGIIYLFCLVLGFFSGYKFWFHEPKPYWGTMLLFLFNFIQQGISYYQMTTSENPEEELSFGTNLVSFFFTVWFGALFYFFFSNYSSTFLNTMWVIVLMVISEGIPRLLRRFNKIEK